ncbi:MAG TPA: 1-acyl-sn-glycerol-3-phosphate acyltransferase [Bacteroidia bacterium]|nr:1-acyl-sn-glycerol-3-phosphate acyltransferase [Bacteroidia bacterium]
MPPFILLPSFLAMNLAKKIVHPFIRAWIKCTCYFYFEKILVKGQSNIPDDGPVILASNHPNSFLDGLVLTAYYKKPIYYLARGDVFSSPFVSFFLRFLNIVPIFRREEGAENFPKNEATFSFCIETFKKDGTILIFSEGGSESEWDLRPLRKGTARLASTAWNDETISHSLKILPATINYSTWLKVNGVAYVTFLPIIEKNDLPKDLEQALMLRKFNEILKIRLEENCIILDKKEHLEEQQIIAGFLLKNFNDGREKAMKAITDFNNGDNSFKEKIIELANYIKTHQLKYLNRSNAMVFALSIAMYDIAVILNFIPHMICSYMAKRITNHNEFYDSVLFCLLLFFYPIYLALLFFSVYFITHSLLLTIITILITIVSAKLREWAKRNMLGYVKRKFTEPLSTMLDGLFQKGNG